MMRQYKVGIKNKVYNRRLFLTLGFLLMVGNLTLSEPIFANGFLIPVQDGATLGTALAGQGSLAEDASVNYYNPAGLTRLCNEQLVAGGIALLQHTKLRVDRAISSIGTPSTPFSGSVKPKNSAVIPWVHYAKPICDDLIFGMSIATSFGSKTNYEEDSIVRYNATRSKLVSIDFDPGLGFRINESFSLGAGINFIWTESKLCKQVGTGDVATDGYADLWGDRWSLGYRVGALYEINDCSRVGLSYRSGFNAKLRGESETNFPVFLFQNISATIKLPDNWLLSAYHAFNECWAIMADAQWFHWKRFNKIAIHFENGGSITSTENYKNSYRVSLGGSYQYNSQWRFRVGTAFDKSPTRDETRKIYFLDQNQIYACLGAQYRVTENLALDFAYKHVFYKKARFNEPAPVSTAPIPQGFQNVQGKSRTRLDVLGLQLTWNIC